MPKRIYDWCAIQAYYDAGNGFTMCRQRFGCSHAAWSKAIKRGDLFAKPTRFQDRRRRHDWSEVQAYYDAGHSIRECSCRFKFSIAAWTKARVRGEFKSRKKGMPIEILLSSARRQRSHVKQRLLNAGLLTNRCERCGLTQWCGVPLNMHLDHVNGVRNDHRLENLRMLCPNCHSQTPTYGGKNARKGRGLQEPPPVV